MSNHLRWKKGYTWDTTSEDVWGIATKLAFDVLQLEPDASRLIAPQRKSDNEAARNMLDAFLCSGPRAPNLTCEHLDQSILTIIFPGGPELEVGTKVHF